MWNYREQMNQDQFQKITAAENVANRIVAA